MIFCTAQLNYNTQSFIFWSLSDVTLAWSSSRRQPCVPLYGNSFVGCSFILVLTIPKQQRIQSNGKAKVTDSFAMARCGSISSMKCRILRGYQTMMVTSEKWLNLDSSSYKPTAHLTGSDMDSACHSTNTICIMKLHWLSFTALHCTWKQN